MKTINQVSPIPNQIIQIPIGNYDYKIRLIDCDSFMAYDLYIDDDLIVSGFRVVKGQLLIPYRFQEVDGNFIIDTNGADPDYKNFGSTQFIRYLSKEESESWREAIVNGEY